MLKTKLAAVGWGSRDSLPSLSSWVLAIILGSLLVVLTVALLALTPYQLFFSGAPLPHPTGNTIVEYFLTSPLHLLLVLVPAALAIWISILDRGREDRYDPLALLAVVLAALGFATTQSGTSATLMHSGEWRPIGLFMLAFAAFAASAGVSLVSLAILITTRSPRRGRMFALFTLVWSAWCGGLVYPFLPVPRDPPPELQDGIELTSVSEGLLRSYWSLRPAWGTRENVRVHANGEIEWEGDGVGNPLDLDGGIRLRRALSSIASRMPGTTVFGGTRLPDEVLYVRADRRAPAAVVARIITGCRDEEIGIWKTWFEVELSRVQEGLPNWGTIATYLPKNVPNLAPEGTATDPPEVIEIHAVENGRGELQPVFRCRGEQSSSAAKLVDELLAKRESSPQQRESPESDWLVRFDPRLPWGTVATTLSELLRLDTNRGAQKLNLVGLELLAP